MMVPKMTVLRVGRNKGCPVHVVESAGNIKLDGYIRGRAFR